MNPKNNDTKQTDISIHKRLSLKGYSSLMLIIRGKTVLMTGVAFSMKTATAAGFFRLLAGSFPKLIARAANEDSVKNVPAKRGSLVTKRPDKNMSPKQSWL
jgi:hypothetical protein